MIFPDAPRSASSVRSFRETVLLALNWIPRLLAVVILAIYLPVLLGVGLLVMLTSSGPALVKKAYRRGGKDCAAAEVVYLYEFRTECWRTWQETPVGILLQKMDLHRLPRLANVLTGEIGVGERVSRITA